MIKIQQVLLDQITEDDVRWLTRGCLGAWDKTGVEDQIEAIRKKGAWLFRITGDAEGVFVLAVANKKERILCMTAMAGKDIVRNFAEIYDQVRKLCLQQGTRKLVGWVQRPGLQQIYRDKTKAVATAMAFSEDLT